MSNSKLFEQCSAIAKGDLEVSGRMLCSQSIIF